MLEPAATVNGGSTKATEEQLVKPLNAIKLYREAEEAKMIVVDPSRSNASMIVKSLQLLSMFQQATKCGD